jgi:hypothetical protein
MSTWWRLAMRSKGDRWNESQTFRDRITGRPVRKITAEGTFNEKPTYHTNTTFTADGSAVVFATARESQSALCRADVTTGEIVQLTHPVPGVLGWAHCHKADGPPPEEGTGITGTTVCLAPRSGWAVYFAGRCLRAVHLSSLEERVLVEDIGPRWIEGAISVDPTEEAVLVPLMPAHPAPGRTSYLDAFAAGGMVTRFLQVPLAGGEPATVFEDLGVGCAHCPHCPSDPDLVLIDRDEPPKFWCGGDGGATARCWLLRLSTGVLTPIVPLDAQRFQVHASWSWDGRHVAYHGWRREGGWYVGVADTSGRVVREIAFPDALGYGHVSASPRARTIILDGNVTKDRLVWLPWDAEEPQPETIAAHDTEWESVPGQSADPHPTTDASGRWVCFNAARGGRSDVYVVDVGA